MNRIQILIVSGDANHQASVISMLPRKPDRVIHSVSSVEAAVELLYRQPFDLVLFDESQNNESENKLKVILNHCSFESRLIKYGQSDLETLANRIEEAVEEKETKKYHHIHVSDTLNPNNLADEIMLIE